MAVGLGGLGLAVECGVDVARSVGPGVRCVIGGTVAFGVATIVSPGDGAADRDGRERSVEIAVGVGCGSPVLPSTAWVGAADPALP